MMKTSQLSLRLAVDDPQARPILAGAADRLLAVEGAPPRLSVTLDGDDLPAPTVAALVATLRRLRESGGALEVVPGSTAIADALRIHGLDRVFAFPLPPEPRSARPHRRGIRKALRAAMALVFAACALAGSARHADAQGEAALDAPAILARVIERNPNLSSYQGRLHVDFRLISFPYVRQHLDATTYFKHPANYEVVFDRVPSYARGFEKLYSDLGDPANWDHRFVITYLGEQRFADRHDLQLHMVQRVHGMIDHETVLVDPRTWAIDEIEYDYYNGGRITMTQQFRDVGGFSLLVSQRADIAIPYVRAVAVGTYDGYQTNVAIDDAVFKKGESQ